MADLERQIAAEAGDQSPSEHEREPVEIFFLQVGENFEQLDYARLPRPTSAPEPFGVPALPQGLKSEPKPHQRDAFAWLAEAWGRRSEEHTSELQSLMRLSYAVFCLKKKSKRGRYNRDT